MRSISPIARSGFASFLGSLVAVVVSLASLDRVQAVDLYWDNNGATANVGTTAIGTWGIDAFWNTASNGTGGTPTATTTATDNVTFSSGSNFTGTFTVTIDGAQAANNLVFQEGVVTLSGGTSLALSGGITKTINQAANISTQLLAAGNLTIANNNSGTLTLGPLSAVGNTNATHVLSITSTGSGNVNFDGVIADAIGANANKSALLINTSNTTTNLNAANTFTGGITVTAGNLTATDSGSTNTFAILGTNTITLNGGRLYLRSNGAGSTQTINVGNNVIVGGNATIELGRPSANSNNTVAMGSLTIGSATLTTVYNDGYRISFTGTTLTGDATLNIAGTNVSTFGAVSESGGSFWLTKTGSGTVQLSGSATHSGGTFVNDGLLNVGTAPTLGADVAGSNVVVAGNGRLQLNAATNLGNNQTFAFGPAALPLANSVNDGAVPVLIVNHAGALPTFAANSQSGVIALNQNYAIALDQAQLGNSYLGANSGVSYTAATLGVGSDGTFRLGGGGSTLTVTNGVLTGSANLVVGVSFYNGRQASNGTGTVVLQGANTFNGTTTVNPGSSLALSGASGSIAGSSAVFVTGGTLNLDNASGNLNRIGDAVGVTLNRATLTLAPNSSINTTENIGALTFVNNANVSLTTASSRVTTLNAASFARTDEAVGIIRGSSLGGPAGTTNITTVTLNNLSGLTQVGTTTAATAFNGMRTATNLKIVPYLIADTSSSGLGTSFATYDLGVDNVLGGTDTGFRPLGASETVTLAALTANDQNVRDNGAALTTADSSNTIMNSLVLNPGGGSTLTGGAGSQLTVTSGGLALLPTTNQSTTISGFSQLNLGQAATDHAEAVIFVTGNGSNASTLTINSSINPGQAIGLTKAGFGTLTIGTAQSFTGEININSGRLNLNATSNHSAININGATFAVGTGSAGAWGGANAAINVNSGGNLLVDNSGPVLTNFGGGNINLNDGGKISLTGGGGTVNVFTNRVVVTGNGFISQNSGGGSGNKTNIGPITLNAGAMLTTLRENGSTNGFGTGVLTLLGDATINSITNNLGDPWMLNVAQIVGNGSFTKTGAGELWLAYSGFNNAHVTGASSTYSGDTHIRQGNLRMGRVNALPTGTTVFVNSGARYDMSTGGYENTVGAHDQTIAGLNDGPDGGGTVTANATSSNVGAKTLTLGSSGTYDFSGVIRNNTGSGTATLALVKSGSGTQTLSGDNLYTGATTVSGGKLLVDGSLAAGSAVTVSGGATLGGSGVVNGSVLANANSIVAPGNSPGSLQFGSYNQQATSLLDIEIGNGDPASFVMNSVEPYDRLVVTGLTSLAGDLQVTLIDGMALEDGQLFGIVDRQGGIGSGLDVFANYAEGDLVLSDAGANLYITYLGNITDTTVSQTGGMDIVLYAVGSLAVPEPATISVWAVIGVACCGFALIRGRRRNRA